MYGYYGDPNLSTEYSDSLKNGGQVSQKAHKDGKVWGRPQSDLFNMSVALSAGGGEYQLITVADEPKRRPVAF